MILYMGVVLYAPALALEAITGITKANAILLTGKWEPRTRFIPSPVHCGISILIAGIVCTFYSTIGGMKAVLITDVFQSFLMFAAIYCVIIITAIKAGGVGAIWEAAERGGRLNFHRWVIIIYISYKRLLFLEMPFILVITIWSSLSTDMDPTSRNTWASLTIGGFFTYLSLYAVNQTQVQRLLTVKDLKASQMALWLNWPILTLLSLSTAFSGLSLFYYYGKCDPVLQQRISSRDQVGDET